MHRSFVLLTTLLLAGSSLHAQPALARTPLTVSSSSLPASQQPLSTPSFVVNTNQDDAGTTYSQCGATTGPGTCSLRDALAAAQNAGTGNITFDAAVFASSNDAAANTIVLANGVLNVPGSTSVTGPTPTVVNGVPTPVVTVSGNHAFMVFEFAPAQTTATAVIANLAVSNGTAVGVGDICGGNPCPGGIYNTGTLTVTASTFSSDSSPNSCGGGIFHQGGSLTVTGGMFLNNSASDGAAICAGGGPLTVSGSTFTTNTADSGGAISTGAQFGGGIYGSATVTNSTFFDNVAATGYGGGIYNSGILTVTGSTFLNNSAFGGEEASTPDMNSRCPAARSRQMFRGI